MKPIRIEEGVYQLSVNVEGILFEEMWEIPNGVSVNSYIVKGEKTAIIDGVCGWDGVPETLLALLAEIDIKPEDIDYLVVNHMEPDHSGWIENFKKITSDFEIICTKKAAKLLDLFYKQDENIRIVKEGDTLDLGNGRILSFHDVPFVHWPETMMTFDTLSKTLFSCDLYGIFGKIGEYSFDDALSESDYAFLEEEGLRYYSNVMTTFSLQVKKAIEKSEKLPIKIIAPGHGLVWRKNPQYIIDSYKRYAGYGTGFAKKEVMILWGSMYGMTEKVVGHIEKLLEEQNIVVHSHRVPKTSWGQVLTSALRSSAVIVAAPTYEYSMFPPAAAALEEIGRKKMNKRVAFCVGSHGWASGTSKEFKNILERYRMKWDVVESIEFKGNANESEIADIEKSVLELVEKMNAIDYEA